jgi:hypothetical protein
MTGEYSWKNRGMLLQHAPFFTYESIQITLVSKSGSINPYFSGKFEIIISSFGVAIIGNNFLRNTLFTLFLHQNTYNMDIIKKDPGYEEYISLLSQIKSQIKVSQIKATLSINAEMLYSYWFTGKSIIYMLDHKRDGVRRLFNNCPMT